MKNLYLSRYAYPEEVFHEEPASENPGIIVTIPCYNEPDLISSLESLNKCRRVEKNIEVIVIINQPENSSAEIKNNNESTYLKAVTWKSKHQKKHIKFLISPVLTLPQKKAGVGLARKIAMDEAIRRLNKAGQSNGIIAGFDADATCDINYFEELETVYKSKPGLNGASIYFEHPLNIADNTILNGISSYELHLRYYVQALRVAGYPYAFHCVGSSMTVDAQTYQKQGGMNNRKAGEDFYFLQKIMKAGNYGEINRTRIIPSPRVSTRVPFGTGKAMAKWTESHAEQYLTYSPETFIDLKSLIAAVESCYSKKKEEVLEKYDNLPQSVQGFIGKEEWIENIVDSQEKTTTSANFRKRVYHWLSGLKILQFVHSARDQNYANIEIKQAIQWLFVQLEIPFVESDTLLTLLIRLREYERKNPYYFAGLK